MGSFKFTVSKAVFETLVKHLVDVEDEAKHSFDEFISLPVAERKKYEGFLQEYIKDLDNYIKNTVVDESVENSLPFVVVGSEVVIENLDNSRQRNLLIVSPLKEVSQSRTVPKASCFSPLGHGLLLKKVGETIEVNAPAGVYRYRINSIDFSKTNKTLA